MYPAASQCCARLQSISSGAYAPVITRCMPLGSCVLYLLTLTIASRLLQTSTPAVQVALSPASMVVTSTPSGLAIFFQLYPHHLTTLHCAHACLRFRLRPGVEGKRLRPTLILLMASALAKEEPPLDCLSLDTRPANEYPGGKMLA